MQSSSVLLELKKRINDFLFEQIDMIMQYSDVGLNTFKWIAFIGVLIKIIQVYYNNPTDWLGYLRWLPLTLLLFNYDIIVEAMYDWGKSLDQQIALFHNYERLKIFYKDTEIDYGETSLYNISLTYLNDFIRNSLLAGIVSFLLLVGFVFSMILYLYLKVKMFFKLLVLVLFGPLNISLSFLNEFQGNYIAWLTKLLEVSTFIPVIYLIDFISVEMLVKCFEPAIISSGGDLLESITVQFVGIVFYVIVIVMYFSVPKIVTYAITQGNNAVGAGKQLAGMTMLAARKLILKV